MNPIYIFVFLTVFALQIGLWFLVRFSMEKRKLMKETVEQMFISKERNGWLGRLGTTYDSSSRGREMETKIKEANLPFKPSEWILARAIAYIGMFVLLSNMLGFDGFLGMAVAVGVVEAGVWILYRYRKSQRLQPVEAQLPDVCRLLGNAVRSGQSIQQGLVTVARVSGDPMGYHFRQLTNELALGMKLEHSFANMAKKLPSSELRFFLNSVLIQKETGGNLSRAMDQMADTLKQRQIVNQAIHTATSEGRLVSIMLPCFGLVFLVILSQAFPLKKLLLNPIGIIITIVFVGGQVIGFLMVRKISQIRV